MISGYEPHQYGGRWTDHKQQQVNNIERTTLSIDFIGFWLTLTVWVKISVAGYVGFTTSKQRGSIISISDQY